MFAKSPFSIPLRLPLAFLTISNKEFVLLYCCGKLPCLTSHCSEHGCFYASISHNSRRIQAIATVSVLELNIQVTQEAVSIASEHRYEKRSESNGNFRSEFRYGSFQRVIPLPAKVQNQQVKADLKDGILTLNLPKLQEEQNKVFKVNLGQSQSAASLEAGNGNGLSTASEQSVETTS